MKKKKRESRATRENIESMKRENEKQKRAFAKESKIKRAFMENLAFDIIDLQRILS